jgi:hypothetical protein
MRFQQRMKEYSRLLHDSGWSNHMEKWEVNTIIAQYHHNKNSIIRGY